MLENLAIVFPGQGSQYIGMGKDFYDSFDLVKKYFDMMNEIKGSDLKSLIFSGDPDLLRETDNAQVAIYTLSSAIFSLLREEGIIPKFLAGHSLGEYSAIASSEILSFEDCLKLVSKRGGFLKEASNKNIGKMVAVLGISSDKIESIVKDLNILGEKIEVANYNSPSQTVCSYLGNDENFKIIEEKFLSSGAKRVVKLNVTGSFHSSFMNMASEKLSVELKKYQLSSPKIPVVFNYNASCETDIDKIKNLMINQVNHSVKWVETVKFFVKNGINTILEVGPGNVLSGLNKKIDSSLKVFNIEKKDDFLSFIKS